jgi:hypothetical protein
MVVHLELCARSWEIPCIAMAALPLPPSLRNAFTMQVLSRLRACPAESVGVGLAHRIAQNNERRTMVKLASSGSISNSKPNAWHIFNIVSFSCSVRPSMTRSPTLRAYSIIKCISIQPNP